MSQLYPWTPGPWNVAGALGYAGYIKAGDSPIACTYEYATAQGRANAFLAASAPQLFEALKVAEAFISEEMDLRKASFFPNPDSEEREWIGEAKRALAIVCAALNAALSTPAAAPVADSQSPQGEL